MTLPKASVRRLVDGQITAEGMELFQQAVERYGRTIADRARAFADGEGVARVTAHHVARAATDDADILGVVKHNRKLAQELAYARLEIQKLRRGRK